MVTPLPHSGVPGAIAPRAPNGALLGVCAAYRHVGPLPRALACNPFGHATFEPTVNKDSWQVGSPTETCIMAEKCIRKTTIPTGECLGHRGHQCMSCHGWYHNICMGVFDPTARDSCGRADCKPSEPFLFDAPLPYADDEADGEAVNDGGESTEDSGAQQAELPGPSQPRKGKAQH